MKIQSILILSVLSTSAVVVATRLGENVEISKESRQLQDDEGPKKRINWGDGFDNIGDGDGGLGDFLDDIKDGVGDFLDNITDHFDGNNETGFGDGFGDGLGDLIDNITDGLGDGLNDLIDDIKDKNFTWPNLTDGIADWANFSDWGDFDYDNFTWGQINWDNSSWNDFVEDINLNDTSTNFCGILESAIGIGKEFGIEGNCQCKDDDSGNLAIGCDFQNECSNSSDLCGGVQLNYTVDDDVSVGACVDLENDSYPKVCFDYSYNMSDQSAQTCSATYDGSPCECSIEDGFCLNLNCSMYLPGAAFDSCQLLETNNTGDIVSWLPEFPVLSNNFTQFYENIDWDVLDWENVDLENFKLSEIEWGPNAKEREFSDIIKVDPASNLMCPILQNFIGMSDEFNSSGGCTCGSGEDKELKMDCSFENACVDEETCAAVSLSFSFAKLGGVRTESCVNFANDGHPTTCFAFEIDIAATSDNTCFATYGGKECKCSIDNLCVAVDCSEHEPSAVVDTCQQLDFSKWDPISFIPSFDKPSDKPSDGSTGETSQTSEVESASAAKGVTAIAVILAMISLVL